MFANLLHPRDEIMQTMERIYRHRMTTTSGGNLSIREDDGRIWITPARPELRAMVHAHPVVLVAFSICRRVPDTRLLHQARSVCGEVGLAPYALGIGQAAGFQ